MRGTLAERFWAKVSPEPNSGCWLWTGAAGPTGHGQLFLGRNAGNRLTAAHRVAWTLLVGAVPPGLEVCHKCDNPPCVNPSHLFVGTHAENMQDMARKGRQSHQRHPELCKRGEESHSCKLLDGDVAEMYRAYSAGEATQWELADRFGVTQATVWRIVRGRARQEATGGVAAQVSYANHNRAKGLFKRGGRCRSA